MLLTIVSFIVVLGFLVFMHELGHFLAARHVGVRVQRFSIGFPPKAFGRTIGETEYVLSWVPLGGYVKLEGQNLDDENPNDPRNYAAKSKLQRLYILAAGPAMNLVVALLLMPVVYMAGIDVPSWQRDEPVVAAVAEQSPAAEAGFQAGDRVLALNGHEVATWDALYDRLETDMVTADALRFTVVREGGGQATVSLDRSVFTTGQAPGWQPRIPPVAGYVAPGSAAAEAGLQAGDRIVAIGGEPVERWRTMAERIQTLQGNATTLTVRRGGETLTLQVAPRYDEASERWLVGIGPGSYTESYGFFESFGLGAQRLWNITTTTFVFLGQLVTGQGSMDALGGPVKIGAVVGEAARAGFVQLIFLTAVISLQLGIFNLLPVPVLDGGHIFLLGVEAVKGSPLSAAVRERTQMIGFALLMMLILVVTYNDVLGLMG